MYSDEPALASAALRSSPAAHKHFAHQRRVRILPNPYTQFKGPHHEFRRAARLAPLALAAHLAPPQSTQTQGLNLIRRMIRMTTDTDARARPCALIRAPRQLTTAFWIVRDRNLRITARNAHHSKVPELHLRPAAENPMPGGRTRPRGRRRYVDGNAHDANHWKNTLYYFPQHVFR